MTLHQSHVNKEPQNEFSADQAEHPTTSTKPASQDHILWRHFPTLLKTIPTNWMPSLILWVILYQLEIKLMIPTSFHPQVTNRTCCLVPDSGHTHHTCAGLLLECGNSPHDIHLLAYQEPPSFSLTSFLFMGKFCDQHAYLPPPQASNPLLAEATSEHLCFSTAGVGLIKRKLPVMF